MDMGVLESIGLWRRLLFFFIENWIKKIFSIFVFRNMIVKKFWWCYWGYLFYSKFFFKKDEIFNFNLLVEFGIYLLKDI